MPVGEKQTYRFGPFELDTQCGQLRTDGVGLKLQGQPVLILEILLEKPGQLVTREELRERLWPSDTFVDFDHSLNTAIKKLRQVLGDEADHPAYIETLPRRGYRFVGEVIGEGNPHEISEAGTLAGEDLVTKVTTTLVDAAVNAAFESRWRGRFIFRIAAISTMLMVIGTATYLFTRPLPLPRIVGAHALTKTGFRKLSVHARLVTDGASVYFQEYRPSGLATMQVRINGGEPSEVAVSKIDSGGLRDISPDGSSLLMSLINREERAMDIWIQPLPSGPARLMLRDAHFPLWTPDGKSFLFTRNNDTDLYRSNSDGSDVQKLATLPDITWPRISPDGKHIRFTVAPKYELWEAAVNGSGAHVILPEYEGVVGNWSPDGRYFLFSYGSFFFTGAFDHEDLWALPERRWWKTRAAEPVQLTFGPLSIGAPTVSKDGRKLFAVAAERHGELSVYDRKTGGFVPYLNGIPACYVDFSKDRKWITYVSYPEGTLWRSRIDGSERMQLTSPPLAVITPKWSPDGKLIVFTDVSNGSRRPSTLVSGEHRIYVISADGGAPLLLLAGRFGDPTWSPDGRSIAYDQDAGENGEIRIFDMQTQKSATVPGSRGFWSARWSPDGKYLVALNAPINKIGLFTFATKEWETLPDRAFGYPAWSHDSRFVYAVNWKELAVLRFNVTDHKVEQVASLKGFRSTAYLFWDFGWYGLTPDDRPITTRDTGIEEIYAFDLEYK